MKDTISYIWPIITKYKWSFYGIFFLNAVRGILSAVIIPIFYKKIIDIISQTGVEKATQFQSLLDSIFLIAIFMPLAWFFGRTTQHFVSKFQSKVMKDLQDFSFQKLHGHSYTFFADNFSGALVNKSRKFVRAFESMHDILIDNFWSAFVLFTAMFVVFFFQASLIAFVFLSMSVFYVTIVVLMSRKKVEYDLAESAADSKVTATLADSVTNFLSVKSSSALEREVKNFQSITANEAMLRLRAWMFGNKLNAIQSGMWMVLQIIVVFVTAHLWLTGKISAGMFVLVQSYSVTIGHQFWELGRATTRFTKSMSDMKEMVEIFKQKPDVLDVPNPEICKIGKGVIDIKNISFAYLNGTRVFKSFNLKINSGEKIGLVGHSGSGKSTIVKI
ncbi:MAG: ABC transporter ATP-binding protein, partial [Patescibacteria group bacterium]